MTPTDAKPMTAEERAEQVVKLFMGYEKKSDRSFYDDVLIQIQQACDEAKAEGMQEMREACSQHQHNQYADGYAKGFADAHKKAVRFAECVDLDKWQIVERIKELTPGEGTK